MLEQKYWNDKFPISNLEPGTIIEITNIINNTKYDYYNEINDIFMAVPKEINWLSSPGFMIKLKNAELYCNESDINIEIEYKIIKYPN